MPRKQLSRNPSPGIAAALRWQGGSIYYRSLCKGSDFSSWLEAAVQAMSAYLSADGIGYVLVSPAGDGRS